MQVLITNADEQFANSTENSVVDAFIDELGKGLVVPRTSDEKMIVYTLYVMSNYLDADQNIKYDYLRSLTTDRSIIAYYTVCEQKLPVLEDKVENLHNFVQCVVQEHKKTLV